MKLTQYQKRRQKERFELDDYFDNMLAKEFGK